MSGAPRQKNNRAPQERHVCLICGHTEGCVGWIRLRCRVVVVRWEGAAGVIWETQGLGNWATSTVAAYPAASSVCRSDGATLFVSGEFYKHGAPPALKCAFQQAAKGKDGVL